MPTAKNQAERDKDAARKRVARANRAQAARLSDPTQKNHPEFRTKEEREEERESRPAMPANPPADLPPPLRAHDEKPAEKVGDKARATLAGTEAQFAPLLDPVKMAAALKTAFLIGGKRLPKLGADALEPEECDVLADAWAPVAIEFLQRDMSPLEIALVLSAIVLGPRALQVVSTLLARRKARKEKERTDGATGKALQ